MAPTMRKALGNHPQEPKRRRRVAKSNDPALRQIAPVANGQRQVSSPELESSSSSLIGEEREGTESESSQEQTQSGSSNAGEESDGNARQSSDEEEVMETSESEEEYDSSGQSSDSELEQGLAEKREALAAALAAAQIVMKTDVKAGAEILKAAARLAEEIDGMERKEETSERSDANEVEGSDAESESSEEKASDSEETSKASESGDSEASDAEEDDRSVSDDSAQDESPAEASDGEGSDGSEDSKNPRNLASEFERAFSEDEESSSGGESDDDDSGGLDTRAEGSSDAESSGSEEGSEGSGLSEEEASDREEHAAGESDSSEDGASEEAEGSHESGLLERGSDKEDESNGSESLQASDAEGDEGSASGDESDGESGGSEEEGHGAAHEAMNGRGEKGESELGKRKERDPTDAESRAGQVDPKRVYVGGMPFTTTEDDIHQYFGECGTIADLDFCTFPDTGKFNGICFITFKTEVAAKRAQALDGAEMGGRFLKVAPCKPKTAPAEAKKPRFEEPPPRAPGSLRAYIGNLDWGIDEAILRDFFSGYNIRAVKWAEDKETGQFKGYGHVDFEDEESLEKAVAKNQELCLGRPMKVAYAVASKGEVPGAGPAGAGGKKGGCFVCGGEGHRSFECPEKPAGGKGAAKGSRACFVCGEEGHKSFECPTKKGGQKAGVSAKPKAEPEADPVIETEGAPKAEPVGDGCFVCGQEGHRSFECPVKMGRAEAPVHPPGETCFECGQAGHKSYQCPQKKRKSGRSAREGGTEIGRQGNDDTCFVCGEAGHKSYQCPSKGTGKAAERGSGERNAKVDKSSDACFVCGQEGHKSYQCPQKEKKVAGPVEQIPAPVETTETREDREVNGVKLDKSVDACFVCGKPGHKSFQCPLKPKRERKK